MSRTVVRRIDDRSVFISALPSRGLPGVNGGVGASAGFASLFAAANGMVVGAGITRIKTSGYSVAGIGGADYIYDAAVTAATVTDNPRTQFVAAVNVPDAAGRGFRLDREVPTTPQMVGALGGLFNDDGPALQAWLDLGGRLHVAGQKHRSAQRLLVRKYCYITTVGYGFDSRIINSMGLTLADMPGSQIKFDAGVGGLYFMNQSVVDDVATNVANVALYTTQEGSRHSHLGPIGIIGGGGVAATGVYIRALVDLDGVQVYNFSGKGFDLSASIDAPDGNSEYGNISLSTLRSCLAKSNGSHGFHIRGRDANVIGLNSCNAQGNGGWGFIDDGFLGNNYLNCHVAANTLGGYKSSGTVADQIYTGCYIESGTGDNVHLGSRCVITGGILAEMASLNATTTNSATTKPTIIGPTASNFGDIQIQSLKDNFGPIVGGVTSHIFRHAAFGLTLQGASGVGGAYSLTFRNANDVAVIQIGNTNTNIYTAGPIFRGDFQVLGERGAAVADVPALTSAPGTAAVATPTKAEFDALVAEFNKSRTDQAATNTALNTLLARVRPTGHGLIA